MPVGTTVYTCRHCSNTAAAWLLYRNVEAVRQTVDHFGREYSCISVVFTFDYCRSIDLLPISFHCSFFLLTGTAILAQQLNNTNQIVGIDISKEVITAASSSYPDLTFVKSDALRDPMSTLLVYKDLCKLHNESKHHQLLYVFVDIGGNRELESLVALLPWVEEQLQPISIIVKSETLYAAVMELGGGTFDWNVLTAMANDAVDKRKRDTEGGNGNGTESTNLNPPTKTVKTLHPLKAPLRKNDKGVAICRFHNYDQRGCRKFIDMTCSGETCPYDHEHCHMCLELGHIALHCTSGTPLI